MAGKPVVFDVQFLLKAGFTKAELTRFRQFNEACDAFGFDTILAAILQAQERAEHNTVRALHRRIPDESNEE
jgi:hypothetical protein